MELGKKIQSLRKKQGLSQEELAEKLSVTRQTVSKWELEQSSPELQYILQISEIFGVSTDYLLKDAADEPDIKTGISSSSLAEPSEKTAQENSNHSSFLRFLGTVLTLCGLTVVIAFIILSVVNPWETLNEYGHFKGLPGYLFGTGSTPYFIIGCISLISGVTIFGINAYRKK